MITFLFVCLQNGVIVSFSLVQSNIKSYHFYQNISTNFHTYLDSIVQLMWLKEIEISFNWENSIKNHFYYFFLFNAPNIDGSIANLSCANLLFPVHYLVRLNIYVSLRKKSRVKKNSKEPMSRDLT